MAAEATLHQAVGNVLKFVTARSERFQKMCATHAQQKVTSCMHALLAADMLYLLQKMCATQAQQKVTSCLHALLAADMLYLLQKMCAAHAQQKVRIRQMRLPL